MTTQLLPDYLERRNSSYLKKDIEILGGNVQDIQEIEVPKIFNEVSALGALYVMEGSIMGGRIIIQMLQKLEIDTGISFFTGYGQDAGDKWGIFTKVMNETASSESQQDETISAANQTFALFEKVFA
jgi:heme oxygenase